MPNTEQPPPVEQLPKTEAGPYHPGQNLLPRVITVDGQVVVVAPPDVKAESAIAEEKRDQRERRKNLRDWITLFFVVLVAGLNAGQTFISYRQADLLRSQIVLDQRPYIEQFGDFHFVDMATKTAISEPISGQPVIVSIQYTNQGNGVALSFHVVRYVKFGKGVDSFFRNLKLEADDGGNTMLPRAAPRTTNAITRTDDFKVQSAEISADKLVNWDGSFPITFVAYFFYKDNFGGSYCTKIADQYYGKGMWLRIDDPAFGIDCEDRPNVTAK